MAIHVYTSFMLALVAAALLVFTDPARPVTGVVRESFLYGVKQRHPEAVAVLLIEMHAEYQGVSLPFPTGYVLMKPRESSPGICRGTLKTYQFDTVAKKWETVGDPEDLFAYVFPPSAKAECALESRPTLLMGKTADRDILGILDGFRTARIAKDHATEGLAERLPHDETIEAISGGTTSHELYTATRKIVFEKRDGAWCIVGVEPAPK